MWLGRAGARLASHGRKRRGGVLAVVRGVPSRSRCQGLRASGRFAAWRPSGSPDSCAASRCGRATQPRLNPEHRIVELSLYKALSSIKIEEPLVDAVIKAMDTHIDAGISKSVIPVL